MIHKFTTLYPTNIGAIYLPHPILLYTRCLTLETSIAVFYLL